VIPGDITEGNLEPIGGLCEGTVQVHIIDPSAITGDRYEISFNDTLEAIIDNDTGEIDTVEVTTLNLYNLDEETFEFTDAITGETFSFLNFKPEGDNLPVVDGFRIYALDIEEEGVRTIGWTLVNGDTSTYDWWTENRTGNVSEYPEVVLTADDWKVVVTDPNETISVPIVDGPAWGDTIFIAEYNDVPLRIYKVTDPDNPVDVSEYLQVLDLRVVFPTSEFMGPLGYDLIPGGKGYNPIAGDVWPDHLRIRDNEENWVNELWIRTQNGPEDAIPPSPGDEFTVETFKPFRSGITYQFQPNASQLVSAFSVDLDAIKVVPNPYIVSTVWEVDKFNKKIQFNHLPSRCTIDIYTIAGDLVATIEHDDDSGDEFWDLKNNSGQNIAYGLYVYVVKTPEGKKRIGKLLVIK